MSDLPNGSFLDPNSQPFLMSLRKIDPPLFLLKCFICGECPGCLHTQITEITRLTNLFSTN